MALRRNRQKNGFFVDSVYQMVTWVGIALAVGGVFYFASKENWTGVRWCVLGLGIAVAIMMGIIIYNNFFRAAVPDPDPRVESAEVAKSENPDVAYDRKQEFRDVFQYLTNNRPKLSKVAMEYYKSRVEGVEQAITGVDLLCRESWIARGNPIDLNAGKSDRLILKLIPSLPSPNAWTYGVKYLPIRGRYVENVQWRNRIVENENSPELGSRLFQAPIYQLTDFNAANGRFEFSCCHNDYFSYMDNCELLHYEFARAVWLQFVERGIKPVSAELNDEQLPLRKAFDVFAFDNRCVGIGISTIFIMHYPDQEPKAKFFIHQRDTSAISEAIGTHHVVPAGTFQPRRGMPLAADTDFSIYLNILRELGEELLGRKEMEEVKDQLSDITEDWRIELYHELVNQEKAKVFFLGWGLDPLTTKAEFLTAMVVNMKELKKKVDDPNFEPNFEGKPFDVPFDEENVIKFVEKDPLAQPAGAGCAQLAWEHREQILNSVV